MDDEVTTRIVKHRDTLSTEPALDHTPQSDSRVFPAGPRSDRYFASEAAERARSVLVRCIERLEGPALLIGPSGAGKSLMLAVLSDSFRFRLSVATLPGGLLRTPRELHQAILYALGLPFRGLDEGELRLSLIQRLEADEDSPEGVLLLVDEAQALSVELMEELRMLTNIVRHGASAVRLVLAGTPVLEEQLADPQLESLHQRIAVRAYLPKLTRSETTSYIQAHLRAAQREVGEFTPEAIDEVYEASEGLPRLINHVCDQALLRAEAVGRKSIDAAIVQEAFSELLQLPPGPSSPIGSSQPYDAECEEVIEFGTWKDPLDAAEAAGSSAFYEDLEGASAEFGHGFGIVRSEPGERIDDLVEQIASISDEESSSVPLDQGTSCESEIDFSLPDNEWPEVEVVMRDTRKPAGGTFKEEEVIADPFPVAGGHRSGWSLQTDVSPAGSGRASTRHGSQTQVIPEDAEPLSSVPLMVHVQTELYSPDPVLPESIDSEIAVAIPAQSCCDGDTGIRQRLSGTSGHDHFASLPAESPSAVSPIPGSPAASSPSAVRTPSAARSGKKRFATLFSSLQY